jgi:hypothetical protein
MEPIRLRKKRNLTLNPDGVAKLLQYGASQPVPETNLSRLIDMTIVDFLKRNPHQKSKPKK